MQHLFLQGRRTSQARRQHNEAGIKQSHLLHAGVLLGYSLTLKIKAIHSFKTMVAFHPLHSIISHKTELFKTLKFFVIGNVRCLYSTLWCMVSGLWWIHILSIVTAWLKSFHLLHHTSSTGSNRYPNSYAYATLRVVFEPSLHRL
jgi:hypothetical protein